MTFDQIEEARRGETPRLSLQQAARNVRLGFQQCPNCRGAGYTKATLLASPRALEILSRECPKEMIPIQFDKCFRCDGAGGWIINPL